MEKQRASATRSVIKLTNESNERAALARNRDMAGQEGTTVVWLKVFSRELGPFLWASGWPKPNDLSPEQDNTGSAT
jgi:hypothetical protein